MVFSSMRLCLLSLFLFTVVNAREWVISPTGSDEGKGTADAPFATIARAVRELNPGDECVLRAGQYHEVIEPKKLTGSADKPIIFRPWPGEVVVIDGTRKLPGEWKPWKDGIYRCKVAEPVKQLFIGTQLMMPARWPNADLYDDSVWDLHGTWRHIGAGSKFGHITDSDPILGKHGGAWVKDSRIKENTQSLADTGKSFIGASIVMNIGSWMSWAQRITGHEAGSNELEFSLNFSGSGKSMERAANAFPGKESFWQKKILKNHEGYYHIEGALACLDAPGEWFHDTERGWLYVMPRSPEKPAWDRARVRVLKSGLNAKGSRHLHFRGLHFFAAHADLRDCRHILIEDCRFDFPSASGIPVGNYQRPAVTRIVTRGEGPTQNIVRNCTFEYCDGPGIEMEGHSDIIENCLFRAVDWTCLGTGGEGSLNLGRARSMMFRHNTLDLAGNSEGVRVGPASQVEYNLVTRCGLLQHDGSAINVGVANIEGTTLYRNWVHDTAKASLRFDSANMGSPDVRWGENGAMIENVIWRSQQMKVKGDRHRIIGNTAFDNRKIDLPILDSALGGGINKKTLTAANLAGRISGSFSKPDVPVPGIVKDNHTGDVREQLRAPDLFDFRPKPGSSLIHGASLPDKRHIGAYGPDPEDYWIPGRMEDAASFPVPPDDSTDTPTDFTLMWRPALNATHYEIYWSTRESEVRNGDKSLPAFRGRRTTHSYQPPAADPEKSYYWRVDSVTPNGTVPGEVWSYRVAR